MTEDNEQQRHLTRTGAYRLQPRVNARALLGMESAPDSLQTYGRYLFGIIPDVVRDAARDATGARALVLAILFDSHEEFANDQVRALAEMADQGLMTETLSLRPLVESLGEGCRLVLLELALPALRRMSTNQYQQFKDCLGAMAGADRWFDLLEYTVHRIVARSLDPIFLSDATPSPAADAFLPQVSAHAQVVLSALVWVSCGDQPGAGESMAAAVTRLRMNPAQLPLLPNSACTLGAVDDALDALTGLVQNHKQVLLQACIAGVAGGGEASLREAELLRAIASALAIPLPALVPGEWKPNGSR